MKTKDENQNQAGPDMKLVTGDFLSKRYGVSDRTIYRWAKDGFLPCYRLGRRCVRYPLQACDDIVNSRRMNALSEVEA